MRFEKSRYRSVLMLFSNHSPLKDIFIHIIILFVKGICQGIRGNYGGEKGKLTNIFTNRKNCDAMKLSHKKLNSTALKYTFLFW